MNIKEFESFYEKVNLMNHLTKKELSEGACLGEFFHVVKNQAERVLEEAKETIEASEDADIAGVLDGVVDILVTALPLIKMAETVGYDVEGAMHAVADNNLTKLTKNYSVAFNTVNKFNKHSRVAYIDEIIYNGEKVYCVKRIEDDKYLKPEGYVSVDLTEYWKDVM